MAGLFGITVHMFDKYMTRSYDFNSPASYTLQRTASSTLVTTSMTSSMPTSMPTSMTTSMTTSSHKKTEVVTTATISSYNSYDRSASIPDANQTSDSFLTSHYVSLDEIESSKKNCVGDLEIDNNYSRSSLRSVSLTDESKNNQKKCCCVIS